MKNLVIIFMLIIVTVSCSKKDDITGPGAVLLASSQHFEVNYNGPWSGNYISNGNIYDITNYGSAVYSNYEGMAIRKNDVTGQTLELKLLEVRIYDVFTNTAVIDRRVTTGSNVIRIE